MNRGMTVKRLKALGDYLKFCLNRQGQTQLELARLLEISPQYLNDILKGNRRPTTELISRLVIQLGEDQDAWCLFFGCLPDCMSLDHLPINEANLERVRRAITAYEAAIKSERS